MCVVCMCVCLCMHTNLVLQTADELFDALCQLQILLNFNLYDRGYDLPPWPSG